MKTPFLIIMLIASTLVVAGGCVSKKEQTPRAETPKIESLSTAAINSTTSTQVVDMPDWKSYKDELSGINIKLPSAWKLTSNQNAGLHFVSSRSSLGTIDLSTTVTTSTIEEIIKVRASGYMGSSYDGMKPATLAGMNGYRITNGYGPSSYTDGEHLYTDHYLLNGNGVFHEITFLTGSTTEVGMNQDIADWEKILGTISRN